MLNEDEKISINLEKLFPEAARRAEILEELKKSWGSFIINPAIAKHSTPYNLGVNEISIAVDNPQAANMLRNSKGTILRALRLRFHYVSQGEFNLKITEKIPDNKKHDIKKSQTQHAEDIKISEDELNEKMAGAPATLPKDINHAISHLKIFLEKRADLM